MLEKYLREAAEAMAKRQTELGKRIREARDSKRWKQKELAARLHVEPVTVSRWERGVATPDLDTVEGIARETGKPMAFFFPSKPASNGDAAAENGQVSSGELRTLQRRLEAEVDRMARLNDEVEARLAGQAPARGARTQRKLPG